MNKFLKVALIYVPLSFLVLSVSWVLVYKWAPVKWTPLMLKRTLQNRDKDDYSNVQFWVDIEEVSPNIVNALIAAEDQRFYHHHGIDFVELGKMRVAHKAYGEKMRGCSTISQQVAKNCFTFGTRTYVRKAIEAYYTLLIEAIWGKERILEVYINVAETGYGLFGVEAACQHYYGHSSEKVSVSKAAAIACIFPSPLKRTPHTVRKTHARKHAMIVRTIS